MKQFKETVLIIATFGLVGSLVGVLFGMGSGLYLAVSDGSLTSQVQAFQVSLVAYVFFLLFYLIGCLVKE